MVQAIAKKDGGKRKHPHPPDNLVGDSKSSLGGWAATAASL
jgi:hypothetical protein